MSDIQQPDLQTLVQALSAGDQRGKAVSTGIDSFQGSFKTAQDAELEAKKQALKEKMEKAGIVSGAAANAARPDLNLEPERDFTPSLIEALTPKTVAAETPAQAKSNKLREQGEKRRGADQRLKIGQAFENLPEVKKSRSALADIAQVRAVVESNTPIEAASVPTFAARMAGEVGALSEADKRPFGSSRQVKENLTQMFSTYATTGTLTPENQEYLRTLATTLEKNRLLVLRRRAEGYAKVQGKLLQDPQLGKLIIDALMEGIPSESPYKPDVEDKDVMDMTDEELEALANGK